MALPTTADEIWPYIEKWPFAVLGFVTPSGEPRAAGVMYTVRDRVLNVLTGSDTWKAKHIRANPNVVVTVTVQRLPITIRQAPPAVITFPGRATVVPIDAVDAAPGPDRPSAGEIDDDGVRCVDGAASSHG